MPRRLDFEEVEDDDDGRNGQQGPLQPLLFPTEEDEEGEEESQRLGTEADAMMPNVKHEPDADFEHNLWNAIQETESAQAGGGEPDDDTTHKADDDESGDTWATGQPRKFGHAQCVYVCVCF